MTDEELDDPRPKIELTMGRVCCPLHSEPFREEWPKGWMPFSLTLMQAALASETLADEAEQSEDWVNGALDRVPLCERVEPAVLEQAYVDCGLGKLSRCDNCSRTAQGVTMRLMMPGNMLPTLLDHVCFECITTRLRHPSA
jgi:hypothetical protein